MQKPSRIIKFLDNILPPDLHHLIGDLEEEFHIKKKKEGVTTARFNFWSQFLRSLPWFIFQSLTWNTTMFLNYLKVSWRNMKKHTGFSLINVLGLAASLAVCLLMILFIIDQKSYDRFHENKDEIVRITTDIDQLNNSYATSPASFGKILNEQYPEVKEVVQIQSGFSGDFRYSEIELSLSGMYANQKFFSVFDFSLLQGDAETALQKPGSIILTPESARKIFGNEDPVGKIITKAGDRDYTVTGIIENSQKSHFDFEVIASYSTMKADPKWVDFFEEWQNSFWNSYTYLLLDERTDHEEFEAKIQEQIHLQYIDGETSRIKKFTVQPLTSINLGPLLSNEIGLIMPAIFAWFLIGFTLILILIACFNYVSLTIARALNRSKEVGVRKVHGAYRSTVIKQFIIESLMISLFALLFSMIVLRWLLPEFNNLMIIDLLSTQVDPSMLWEPHVIFTFVGFAIIVGIAAGFYPALYLSSFNPAQVLKGIAQTNGISGQKIKKFITVGQFTFSIIFITTSLIMYFQFRHLADTDYGFDKQAIVNIQLKDVPFSQLRDYLVQDTNIQSITSSSLIPATGTIYSVDVTSDLQHEEIEAHSFRVSENYIQTMGLNLLAGRNFNPKMSTDSTSAVIISTELMKMLGFESPADAINQQIKVITEKAPVTVVGVVQNFISSDPLSTNDPIVLLYKPDHVSFAVIKTMPGKTISFISGLDDTWASMNSVYPLKYTILDEELTNNPSLTSFIDLIKVLGLVAGFSIFISCLGLLGLTIYSTENRIKEIGIRKILGASVNQLVYTLSKEYLWMILTAIAISIPASWFINSLWLQNVSNKADFGIMIHIAGALIATLLALLTMSTQTFRAARTSPVKNLRSE